MSKIKITGNFSFEVIHKNDTQAHTPTAVVEPYVEPVKQLKHIEAKSNFPQAKKWFKAVDCCQPWILFNNNATCSRLIWTFTIINANKILEQVTLNLFGTNKFFEEKINELLSTFQVNSILQLYKKIHNYIIKKQFFVQCTGKKVVEFKSLFETYKKPYCLPQNCTSNFDKIPGKQESVKKCIHCFYTKKRIVIIFELVNELLGDNKIIELNILTSPRTRTLLEKSLCEFFQANSLKNIKERINKILKHENIFVASNIKTGYKYVTQIECCSRTFDLYNLIQQARYTT